ncbi:MAG TPA: mannose-1-phosphate guanylyltransferase [Myxococcota bacterium]|nr:mannose-1-phosphate guanylyltransferase [Myxococcota bacterium]
MLHAVILAGGAGERFWPASRARRPKPFLRVVGGRTLLDATLLRARKVAGAGRVWVVCGNEHAKAIRRATRLPASRVLVEPTRRNTAAAVAFAALRIARSDPDAVMVVLPADHHIPDTAAFVKDIRLAARAAREAGVLVTLGVRPTRPETGYGYIDVGALAGRAHPGLHRVRQFVEKPVRRVAERYVRGGRHLWNAGIFVFGARTVLEEIGAHAPELAAALAPLGARGRVSTAARLHCYRSAPSVPIDVAVMEKSRRVWTLPVRWRWSDVGTWESLAGELGVGPGSSKLLAGELVYDDGAGNLVWGQSGRPIALLGVSGLAVVDAGDALLVARLDRSNEVRAIVQALKERGRLDVT